MKFIIVLLFFNIIEVENKQNYYMADEKNTGYID